jgi:hypothetical protein
VRHEVGLDVRSRRLRAALVQDNAPELRLVHNWLDSWSGIGLIVIGMQWQGWDLQLTAYSARDWRALRLPGPDRALDRRRHGVGGTPASSRRSVWLMFLDETLVAPVKAHEPTPVVRRQCRRVAPSPPDSPTALSLSKLAALVRKSQARIEDVGRGERCVGQGGGSVSVIRCRRS